MIEPTPSALTSPIGSPLAPRIASPPTRTLVRERGLRRPFAIGLLGFGALWLVVSSRRTAGLDLAATRAIQRWSGPTPDTLMAAVSWPGFPPESRLIPPMLIGGWLAADLPTEALCQASGWGAALAATLVKQVTRRPRPVAPAVQVILAPLGGTSFPSGHVLSYVGTYGTLAYLLAARIDDPLLRRTLAAGPLALVGLVGISRVHQGHHWLTDVLASYFLGLSYVAVVVALYRRLLRRAAAG